MCLLKKSTTLKEVVEHLPENIDGVYYKRSKDTYVNVDRTEGKFRGTEKFTFV